MIDFDKYRSYWGGLTQTQVDGLNFLVPKLEIDLPNRNQLAYVLATVQEETKSSFQPVKEATSHLEAVTGQIISDDEAIIRLNRARARGLIKRDYWTNGGWFGRGLIQITFENNYLKFGVTKEDMLDPQKSYDVMLKGMTQGLFTGKSLDDYIGSDFVGARHIVNPADRSGALIIAKHVPWWLDCLTP